MKRSGISTRYERCGLCVLIGILVCISGDCAFAQNPFQITINNDTISVDSADHSLFRYQYEQVPFKPYVREYFTPAGVNILRDAPADHLHHHALMFAVAVDGVSFWEESTEPGRQAHRSIVEVRIDKAEGLPRAGFRECIDWINPRNKELLLREQRTITIQTVQGQSVTLLNWHSVLEPPTGEKTATLTGARYHGLGMRFVKSMDSNGDFFIADDEKGKVFRDKERLVRSRWCAYTAKADGKPVTVAMFDCPDNPRHPATWFTMTKPFAYLSAAMNLHKQPLKIEQHKPLKLRYGVALWDGRVEKDEIEKLYRLWLNQKSN